MCLISRVRLYIFRYALNQDDRFGVLMEYQMFFIVATMAITSSSVENLQAKLGLPIANQLAGWAILGLCSPFTSPTT